MKRRIHSFFEININNVSVGFSSVSFQSSTEATGCNLSAELLLFNAFRKIEGIQLAEEWSLYQEERNNNANGEGERITRRMLCNAISNYSAFSISLDLCRDVFEWEFCISHQTYKGLLVHEYCWQPAYKQLELPNENTVQRFPIHFDDATILNELRSRLEGVAV